MFFDFFHFWRLKFDDDPRNKYMSKKFLNSLKVFTRPYYIEIHCGVGKILTPFELLGHLPLLYEFWSSWQICMGGVHENFFWQNFFFSILFQKSKCRPGAIKNMCSKNWNDLLGPHNKLAKSTKFYTIFLVDCAG